MELTGIYREATFSPFQHGQNDRLILELTTRALERRGHRVRLLTEENLAHPHALAPVVFSMCQGPVANRQLAAEEQGGRLIINSPRGVQSCYRVNLIRAAGESELLPATVLLETREGAALPRLSPGQSYWIKRGDVHATQRGDVVKVNGAEDCAATIADFRVRGIDAAVLQEHVDGVVVKFYGVVGSSFFRWYAESDHKVCPVVFGAARPAIERFVRRLGLEVYGGDAVLRRDGRIFVIDVNDWPSFACFRSEAAETIAVHVHRRAIAFIDAALARPRSRSASLLG